MEESFVVWCQKYVILLIALGIPAYFWLRRNPRLKYYLNTLPGPPGLPVLGNLLPLLCPHNELMPLANSWFSQYGTTFRIWIANLIPYVFTCDANVIEKVISGHKFINKGKHDYSLTFGWLGTGLLTAPGTKWFSRRKILTPAFHFNILEQFLPIFNKQADILVDCLRNDGRANEVEFDMSAYISKCTLDIICEAAMGKIMNIQTDAENHEYFEAVQGMCHMIIYKNFRPWLRIPLLYHLSSVSKQEKRYLGILHGMSKQVIAARKAERRSMQLKTSSSQNEFYGKERKAFLDVLLDVADETQQLTDADIQEEVDTFMFEGHDTTAVNLGWTILLLAMHPDYQSMVQKEQDDIFADNPARDVTTMDISKMKFLECCLKESMRLFPSVPFISRQIESDLRLDDGNVLPKGSTAFISIYQLHRLSQNFSEPNTFQPERWSTDRDSPSESAKRHPYAYIPFSAGPRNCIGQKFALLEEKVILSKLFRRYSIETSAKYSEIKVLPTVVLYCDGGINVKLRSRV